MFAPEGSLPLFYRVQSIIGALPTIKLDPAVTAQDRGLEKLLDFFLQTRRHTVLDDIGRAFFRGIKDKAIVAYGPATLGLLHQQRTKQPALDDNSRGGRSLMNHKSVESVPVVTEGRGNEAPIVRINNTGRQRPPELKNVGLRFITEFGRRALWRLDD